MIKTVKERAKELEVMLKALPTTAIRTSPEIPVARSAEASRTAEIPAGQLKEFPNSIKIISRKTMQEQWIPRGAKRFRELITGQIETV